MASAQSRMMTMKKVMMAASQTKRILVVDDDLCIRRLIFRSLTAQGYEVDTAEDGAQGWDSLTRMGESHPHGYDLLVTDNLMPNLSGVDLIGKVHSAGMNLPIILASGNLPANAAQLGLSAIMPKPFLPRALAGAVRQVFEPHTKPG